VVGRADKVLSHEVGDAKAYCLPKMCISILKSANFAADKTPVGAVENQLSPLRVLIVTKDDRRQSIFNCDHNNMDAAEYSHIQISSVPIRFAVFKYPRHFFVFLMSVCIVFFTFFMLRA